MIINQIYTSRKYETWPSWFVIFEYEDVLANTYAILMKFIRGWIIGNYNRILSRLIKLFPSLRYIFIYKTNVKKPYKLLFVMNSRNMWRYPKHNTLPSILDFPLDSARDVLKWTERLPIFWVTSYDFYEELKRLNPKTGVKYIPLSVSDIYYSEKVPNKPIDVLQFGRENAILHEWMLEYCKHHPEVEYVYQTAGGSLSYQSTIRGNLGKFDTRKVYFDLLRCAKIRLVSAPCIDGGRKDDFGNIDFFTPRFFESAVNYCYMVGRYTENKEAAFLNIKSVCDNVKNYESFEKLITLYLNSKKFLKEKQYKDFLRQNLTSVRAEEIKRDLQLL